MTKILWQKYCNTIENSIFLFTKDERWTYFIEFHNMDNIPITSFFCPRLSTMCKVTFHPVHRHLLPCRWWHFAIQSVTIVFYCHLQGIPFSTTDWLQSSPTPTTTHITHHDNSVFSNSKTSHETFCQVRRVLIKVSFKSSHKVRIMIIRVKDIYTQP